MDINHFVKNGASSPKNERADLTAARGERTKL